MPGKLYAFVTDCQDGDSTARTEVVDIDVSSCRGFSDMARQMYLSGGFTAKKLGMAADILEDMMADGAFVFLSFPADIVSTGTRGVIKELVRRKMANAIITTCGTLDHDIARSVKKYYHGDFLLDDRELRRRHINRLGNILIPDASYGTAIERFVQPLLEDIYKKGKRRIAPFELISIIGERLPESSILHWASKNSIPVFVPGITDGSVGSQLWSFWEGHRDFWLDLLAEEHALSDVIFSAEKAGALMIGGGISKHHTIWWNQFRGGLDYVVYLTTAAEYDGSLSGAQIREAISWGKVRPRARHVTVEGDATITLPFLVAALLERLEERKSAGKG
ncbi:MAG: deoxyhypusine synthase [Methanomassiliicoccales archaeon]